MRLKIEVGEHAVVTQAAVREPQLFKLRSGDLLLTYHVQPDVHFAERHGLRSRDGGRTWEDEPRRAHREQMIGQGADGTVLAPDIYTFERRPGEYVGAYFRSDDGGASFTGPHELTLLIDRVASRGYPEPEHFPPEDHPLYKFYQPLPDFYRPTVARASQRQGPVFWRCLVEHQGRWLATMQCKYHGDSFYRTVLVASEDRGRTWVFVNNIADFRDGVPGDGFCEPVLCRTADGNLLCVMRRGGNLPLAQCRSLDHGHSWSAPELLVGHGVDPDLCLMSGGVLA
ncbi:MAG: glycoside hydrolase [Lentisphaerae bacterium]|nr:glycoside hydrolase [Lentisphaerota bacterium]